MKDDMEHGSPVYLWLDLETTGLEPERDAILEVAVLATDEHLVRVSAACSWVVQQEPAMLRMDQYVSTMHTKNGLLDELRSAPFRLEGVEDCLMAFVREVFPKPPEQPILAGSSVHFDRSFIKHHMPHFDAMLHYRLFDCRPLQMAAQTAWGMSFPKAEAHRALADVRESLGYARRIMHEMARHEPGTVCRMGVEP